MHRFFSLIVITCHHCKSAASCRLDEKGTLGSDDNSGYYLAPNTVYENLTHTQAGKCSRRDLIADLSAALHTYGIPLIVYLPSGAPAGDNLARTALQWENGPLPNREFQLKWEQVM